MHVIAYVSDFIPSSGDIEHVLKDIVKKSKKNNVAQKVTGVLLFLDGRFVQIIEGAEHDLKEVMSRISTDKRHKNVTILIDESQGERCFGKWSMDSVQLKAGKKIDQSYLKTITEVFKNNYIMRSDTLDGFYKSMLTEKKKKFLLF